MRIMLITKCGCTRILPQEFDERPPPSWKVPLQEKARTSFRPDADPSDLVTLSREFRFDGTARTENGILLVYGEV